MVDLNILMQGVITGAEFGDIGIETFPG